MKKRFAGTQSLEIALATGLGIIVLLICLGFFFGGIEKLFDNDNGYKTFFSRHESFGESIDNPNARDNAGIQSIRTASSDAQLNEIFNDNSNFIQAFNNLQNTLFDTTNGANLMYEQQGTTNILNPEFADYRNRINPNLDVINSLITNKNQEDLISNLQNDDATIAGCSSNLFSLLYLMSLSEEYSEIFEGATLTHFQAEMTTPKLTALKGIIIENNPSDSNKQYAKTFVLGLIDLLLQN